MTLKNFWKHTLAQHSISGANERIKCLREEAKNFETDGFIKAF
jgi:hypothetical protein